MPRKQHKYHYIYKTTCLITERYYIGMHSTSDLEDDYIGSGQRLWKSIKKHGRENHVKEILEWFEDRSSLKNREKELVNENLLKDPNCMNLKLGGEGGFNIEDQRKGGKASLTKLWKDPEYRKRKSLSSSKKLKELRDAGKIKSFDWTGHRHKDETKKKIGEANSISQKGSNNSQYGTCWITNEKENKKINKGDLIPKGWKLGRLLK